MRVIQARFLIPDFFPFLEPLPCLLPRFFCSNLFFMRALLLPFLGNVNITRSFINACTSAAVIASAISALREDYQPNKSSSESESTRKVAPIVNLLDFSDAQRQKNNELEIQYRRYQDKQLLALFNGFKKTEKSKLLKEFDRYLRTKVRGIYHDIYVREGIANPLVQDQLCLFFKREKQDMMSMLKFEEWLATSVTEV